MKRATAASKLFAVCEQLALVRNELKIAHQLALVRWWQLRDVLPFCRSPVRGSPSMFL